MCGGSMCPSLRVQVQEGFNCPLLPYFSAMNQRLHLVECPRDAIQGWPHPISTEDKLAYCRVLLRCGFQTIDIGSFVSPKAVPAMADTGKVLAQLEAEGLWGQTSSEALVIVANARGARDAVAYESVGSVGFPLSLSPTFQERNTRASLDEAWDRLDTIADICAAADKRLVVYLSMGFGNPYGDAWDKNLPLAMGRRLKETFEPSVISLADTIGSADPALVSEVVQAWVSEHGSEGLGAHLHIHPMEGIEKAKAAFNAGCFRLDGAIRGVGGCPMAQDDLVGNAPTEKLVEWAQQEGHFSLASGRAFDQAQSLAADLFG